MKTEEGPTIFGHALEPPTHLSPSYALMQVPVREMS